MLFLLHGAGHSALSWAMFAVSDCCVNKINSDWTACVMQDVDSYVFGINLFAHSDITIDFLTQKEPSSGYKAVYKSII